MPSIRWLVLTAVLMGCGTASAQNMKPPSMPQGEAASRRFPQPVRVGDLIGRTVLQPLESQPILGRVERLVRLPDGTTAVILRYGGVFGLGARPVAVPLDAMVVLGEYMEVVDLTPEQLDALPTFVGADASAVDAANIIKVGLARPSH